MEVCCGDGQCIQQTNVREFKEDKKCPHQCKLIPCPNFIVCKQKLPRWVLCCHGGRCLDCDMFLKCNLHFQHILADFQCPVAQTFQCSCCTKNTTINVEFPGSCKHQFCSDCFSRSYPACPICNRKQIVKKAFLCEQSFQVDFGMHKGKTFDEIPVSYITWLAGATFRNDESEPVVLDVDLKKSDSAWQYISTNYPEVVEHARNFMTKRCYWCGGGLVPIGHARMNGADHADWSLRKLHKKCFKELVS